MALALAHGLSSFSADSVVVGSISLLSYNNAPKCAEKSMCESQTAHQRTVRQWYFSVKCIYDVALFLYSFRSWFSNSSNYQDVVKRKEYVVSYLQSPAISSPLSPTHPTSDCQRCNANAVTTNALLLPSNLHTSEIEPWCIALCFLQPSTLSSFWHRRHLSLSFYCGLKKIQQTKAT